ncbi:Peptidase cysteine/serine, trypsin-like protein [Ophiocordyceps camponoti-floridani]|uniref:Peptidase cysteine/serine, trypsin-like protein n=1 Tax=Ophiocordyceps camponoti-floridani TaxID=2030778 RepID=A0A8H4QDH4_9HYPO|nr:Peptidase cysteine/serine, trypsin-like protein [Ophiocordyceps camponoti-floridani]
MEFPYDDKLNMGACIGARRYVPRNDGVWRSPVSGTLACYVDLLRRGKWEKYAITNHHVVRPALDGFMLDRVEGDGTSTYGEPRLGSDLGIADEKGSMIVDKEPLYKVGTVTGATEGAFSKFKTSLGSDFCAHLPDRRSEECTMIGNNQDFGKPGDSGSIVFTGSGEAVGLLWGGKAVNQSTQPFTLVTPLDDVFQHIKEYSGGAVEDIRISQ